MPNSERVGYKISIKYGTYGYGDGYGFYNYNEGSVYKSDWNTCCNECRVKSDKTNAADWSSYYGGKCTCYAIPGKFIIIHTSYILMYISESSFNVAGDSLYDSYNYYNYKAFACQTVGTEAAATTTATAAATTAAPTAKKYELQPLNTACGGDNYNPGSLSSCKAGKDNLELTWGGTRDRKKGWPQCYLEGDRVYWNTNTNTRLDGGGNKQSLCKIKGQF